MKDGIDRRNFFRSITQPFENARKEFRERLDPLPPYCTSVDTALKNCPGCTDRPCISECPEGIVYLGKGDLPRLNFSAAGCTYCEKCAEVCPHGVLSESNPAKIGANVTIVESGCLAWKSVICYSCKDACDQNAITFEGMKNPRVDILACTRCGLCVKPCPADAISIYTF
ncbi:MAG TPA: ferredoxin-type protein NapF [Bacteroidetes bacterium]|nr:ferredoxin-type protein NapF [Bacteroidota bacterium]HEX05468.1 ferredoxin-type protein NapF [Bacteroidota bacterium]